MNRSGRIASFLILTTSAATSLAQTPRYVSPTGTDVGDATNPNSPVLTVQYAVDQAAAGDEIRLQVGTYTEAVVSLKAIQITGDWGPGFVRNSPIDPNRTVLDGGGTDRPLSISPNQGTVTEPAAILQGFRITNGDATDSDLLSTGQRGVGGGLVFVKSGSPMPQTLQLDQMRIDHNVARSAAELPDGLAVFSHGGGIATDGRLVVTDSIIEDNIANNGSTSESGLVENHARGGGIFIRYVNSSAPENSISNSIIRNNTAQNAANIDDSSAGGYGGGLYIQYGVQNGSNGTFASTGNQWQNNFARSAGAVPGDGLGGAVNIAVIGTAVGSFLFSGDTFDGNVANAADLPPDANPLHFRISEGGGIYFSVRPDANPPGAPLTLRDCAFNGNVAKRGAGVTWDGQAGAVAALEAELTIEGGSFIGNIASESSSQSAFGGAVSAFVRSLDIRGATFRGNATIAPGQTVADFDMGSAAFFILAASAVEDGVISNCIFADNHGSDGAPDKDDSQLIADNGSPMTFRVLHNTIAQPAFAGNVGLLLFGSNHSVMDNIFANSGAGIEAASGVSNAAENYNLFFGNTSNVIGGGITSGANGVFLDPMLDANFHLTGGSPAIDAGIDAGIADDIDGGMRPAGLGFDIGADEFGAGPDIPSLQEILDYVLGIAAGLTPEQIQRLDLNEDGEVDAADVAQRVLLGN